MKITNKKKSITDLTFRLLVVSLFCFLGIHAFAQTKAISLSGTVTDPKGQALIGVNVIATGTSAGTITDFDGKWSLSVPTTATELKFSYIGYTDKAVAIGTSRVINVQLAESTEQIDELVVIELE